MAFFHEVEFPTPVGEILHVELKGGKKVEVFDTRDRGIIAFIRFNTKPDAMTLSEESGGSSMRP